MTNNCVIAGRRKTPPKQSGTLAGWLGAGLPRAFQSLAMTALLLAFAVHPARAACTDPAGAAGQIIYNGDQNVPQFCDGSDWIALGVFNPAAGSGGCTGPAGVEGEVIYNGDANAPQYCDGEDWREMSGRVEVGGLTGPTGCANIGDLCADGTVFAGWHPITQEHLFIPTTDQGTTSQWKTSADTEDIATDSAYDGRANTDQVANSTTFPAFKLCKDLGTGGHGDWYLPSQVELFYIWSVHETIEAGGNITNFQSSDYWSSTEWSYVNAWFLHFTYGIQSINGKTDGHRVRCVRR